MTAPIITGDDGRVIVIGGTSRVVGHGNDRSTSRTAAVMRHIQFQDFLELQAVKGAWEGRARVEREIRGVRNRLGWDQMRGV